MKRIIVKKISEKEITAFALNTTDAAKYIGVSSSLLRKLRDNSEGPAYCKIGTRVVYPIIELKGYLKINLINKKNS